MAFITTSRFNTDLKPYLQGENSRLAQKKYDFTIKSEHATNLLIDSNDRDFSVYPDANNFIIKTPTNQVSIYRFALTNFYMIWDLPNVINGKNNSFFVNGFQIVLEEGIYQTPAIIASAIQTQLVATIGAGWTCTINPITKAIQIQSPAPLLYNVSGSERTQATYGILDGTLSSNASGLYIGKIPTMFYTRYFDVQSRELTKYSRSDSATDLRTTSLISRVYHPPYANPGPYDFEVITPKPLLFGGTNITQIDITLYDEWAEPLYVPFKSQFSYGLIFQITNQPEL